MPLNEGDVGQPWTEDICPLPPEALTGEHGTYSPEVIIQESTPNPNATQPLLLEVQMKTRAATWSHHRGTGKGASAIRDESVLSDYCKSVSSKLAFKGLKSKFFADVLLNTFLYSLMGAKFF